MNLRTRKTILTAIIVVLSCLTFIDPPYPEQLLLQHSGTLLILLFLVIDIIKNKWKFSAFLGISLFTILHIIGARYIYSFVPYNEWMLNLTGFDFNEAMEYERNHFDRFVHFSFGILIFPVIFHFAMKKTGFKVMMSVLFAWFAIQTFSLIYEVFEWGLTIFLSGEAATNYNGQQGDIWDPQKDMALAMLGSILMGIFYWVKYRVFGSSVK